MIESAKTLLKPYWNVIYNDGMFLNSKAKKPMDTHQSTAIWKMMVFGNFAITLKKHKSWFSCKLLDGLRRFGVFEDPKSSETLKAFEKNSMWWFFSKKENLWKLPVWHYHDTHKVLMLQQ